MKGPGTEANATRVIFQPQMLDKSKETASLLDGVQKGWSDSLEEKTPPVLSKVNSSFHLSVACYSAKICFYKDTYKVCLKKQQSF